MTALTPSEKRVLDTLCRHACSNKEIGGILYLEEDTIKSHLKSIFRKKGFRNRLQAIVWGRANGYGQSQDSDPIQLAAQLLPFYRLSPRQYEVVKLVARGKTNPEIADELGISELTVKSTLAQAARLLGQGDRNKIALAYKATHGSSA